MIALLKSEARKLLTVRSTYVLTGLCLALTLFFGLYLEGLHKTRPVLDPGLLGSEVISAAQALALFIALVGLLMVTHEYRHNTITYTLTAARSRTQVLLAKTVIISLFALIVSLVLCTAAPYLAQLGLHLKGLSIVPQDLPLLQLLARSCFYVWGYAMIAMIAAFIFRNQVGALSFVLLFPGVENLLGLLLKDNAKYLPFNALSQLVRNAGVATGEGGALHLLTHVQAAEVVLAYVIGGWLIAWLLLTRRDAN